MTLQEIGDQAVFAGLTLTSFAGVMGYVPIVVAVLAGVMAIISYVFTTLDSPTFQKWWHRSKSNPPQ
jgi:hypothetical protein